MKIKEIIKKGNDIMAERYLPTFNSKKMLKMLKEYEQDCNEQDDNGGSGRSANIQFLVKKRDLFSKFLLPIGIDKLDALAIIDEYLRIIKELKNIKKLISRRKNKLDMWDWDWIYTYRSGTSGTVFIVAGFAKNGEAVNIKNLVPSYACLWHKEQGNGWSKVSGNFWHEDFKFN